MIDALWVGGPPGDTLKNLTAKLARDGINVLEVQRDYHAVPARAQLVLANIDMCDHGSSEAAREAATKRGVPYVAVRTDYSRTRLALISANIITTERPEPIVTTTIAPKITPAEAAKEFGKNPGAVAEFLAALPREQWAGVLDEVLRLQRSEKVTAAVLAFCELDPKGVEDFTSQLSEAAPALFTKLSEEFPYR